MKTDIQTDSDKAVDSGALLGVLLPCPFCGSGRVEVRFYNQPSVVCLDCLAMGPASDRLLRFESNKSKCAAQASLLWNKRERTSNE